MHDTWPKHSAQEVPCRWSTMGDYSRRQWRHAVRVRRYAASNTRRGVESCGILAGALDEAEGAFRISTLIIPKQEGTSDTVQARAAQGSVGVLSLSVSWGGGLMTTWCTRIRCLAFWLCLHGPYKTYGVTLAGVPCGAGAQRGGDLRRAGQAVAVPAGLDPHAPHPDLLPLLRRRAHPVRLPGAAPPSGLLQADSFMASACSRPPLSIQHVACIQACCSHPV